MCFYKKNFYKKKVSPKAHIGDVITSTKKTIVYFCKKLKKRDKLQNKKNIENLKET